MRYLIRHFKKQHHGFDPTIYNSGSVVSVSIGVHLVRVCLSVFALQSFDKFPRRCPRLCFLVLAHRIFATVQPAYLKRTELTGARTTSASRCSSIRPSAHDASCIASERPGIRTDSLCIKDAGLLQGIDLATQPDIDGREQGKVLGRGSLERGFSFFDGIVVLGFVVCEYLDSKSGVVDQFCNVLLRDVRESAF